MLNRLIQRRMIWWPTLGGWLLIVLVLGGSAAWWFLRGEAFFALTERQPAEVLVFEGWIGTEGLHAAKAEFDAGGYRYIVATGGLTGKFWYAPERRWSLVEIARIELQRMQVPADKIIEAPTPETDDNRTFAIAKSTWRSLHARGIQPKSINVFTLAAHARRSRLIYSKVFGPEVKVGVVAWLPPGYESGPWWKSSERAEEMLKETAGYPYELFLNSGRRSNSPSVPDSKPRS